MLQTVRYSFHLIKLNESVASFTVFFVNDIAAIKQLITGIKFLTLPEVSMLDSFVVSDQSYIFNFKRFFPLYISNPMFGSCVF